MRTLTMHNASFDENLNRRSAESKQFVIFTLAATAVCVHSLISLCLPSWWDDLHCYKSVREKFLCKYSCVLKNISLAWELNWAAEKTRKLNIWYHHKISQEIFKGPNIYLSRCAASSLLFSFFQSFCVFHFGARGEKNSTLFSIVFAACFCGFLSFFHLKKLRIYI